MAYSGNRTSSNARIYQDNKNLRLDDRLSSHKKPVKIGDDISGLLLADKDVFVEKFTELANEEFRVTAKSKFTLPEDIEGITPSDFPIIEMIFDLSDWSDEDEEDDEESEE